jgi:hypothetical protein
MSHYAVLVIGGDVAEQLAPYHEFESTGTDDQYVQEIDQTEEARDQWNSDTTTRYRDVEGNLQQAFTEEGNYKPEFLRDPTPEEQKTVGIGSGCGNGLSWTSSDWGDGRGYRAKIFTIPEGLTKVEVSRNTVETFADFCVDYYGHTIVPFGQEPNFSTGNHKYGYTIVDENGEVVKTIDRTNPDRKWDWYTVGGRWNGFFKLKPHTVGVLGKPGLQTMDDDYEPPTGDRRTAEEADRADVCMKGDIDIEGMRDEASEQANKRYSMYDTATYGTPEALSWQAMQVKHQTGMMESDGVPAVDWKTAREEYAEQPRIKALRANKETIWFENDEFLCTREEYVQRFRNQALTLFAVLKDGKWYERGEMGWWGVVHDEKDRNEWNQKFSELIDELSDNTVLTVVDCHI